MPTQTELDLALAEARATHKIMIDSIDALDAKARTLLGSASLIIAIIGAFQLNTYLVSPLTARGAAVLMILIYYVMLVARTASGIGPVGISAAVQASYDVYKTHFFDVGDELLKKKLLKSYARSTVKMEAPMFAKANLVSRATIELVVIVVILLITPFLPA